jgi:hypothetical protein
MKLHVSELAQADAQEAANFYEQRVRGLGDRFLEHLNDALGHIEANSLRFGLLETLPERRDVRRVILSPFSYFVAYQVRTDEIFVAAIAHTSRRPNFWIKRLKS